MGKTLVAVVMVIALAVLIGVTSVHAGETATAGMTAPKIRVGTYDNRAVAIAWVRSDLNNLSELGKELEAAKKAGDQKKIDELNELGTALQRKLHFQGFGHVPVTDLLEVVEGRLDEAAEAAGVDAIVFECNYAGEGVEVVDVTDAVVELFEPTPETWKVIRDIRTHDPVPLEDIDHEH